MRNNATRPYLALILTILLIKSVVVLWGVYSAHNGTLSRRDYARNYHHHRIIERWTDAARIRFFELWVVSDAQWYNAIAEDGYPSRTQFDEDPVTRRPKLIATTDTQLKFAFFPLWPIVIRCTQFVIRDVDAAGFVAANILSIVSLITLFGFLATRFGTSAAFWSVVLLTCTPFALFLHVPFSESLFLFLTVFTFIATEKRLWLLLGISVGLGMIARPNGIALILVPLAYGIVRAVRDPGWFRGQFPDILWALIAGVPPALLLWHNYTKTGDAFYFTQATDWWGYEESSAWSNLWHNTYGKATEFFKLPWHGFHRSRIDYIVLVSSTVLCLTGIRMLPLHYTAYALGVLAIPLLAKDDLMSYSRYAMMAWPIFLVPALLIRTPHRPWVMAPLCGLFLFLQMCNIGAFVNWHWVG